MADHDVSPAASYCHKLKRLSHADYTVACICPQAVTLAPLRAMLDAMHDDLPTKRDHNAYVLGELGKHNVVIAVLPSIGNNCSGIAATQILNDFPSIRFILLVGIAGGVPGNQEMDSVRLGDVVVSQQGVLQFDKGKRHHGGRFEQTGCATKPAPFLTATIEKLKAQHRQEGNRIQALVSDMLRRNPRMSTMYAFPGQDHDCLFDPDYQHTGGRTCSDCDITRRVAREKRIIDDLVRIHYGTIGSSNSVLRDSWGRDRLGQTCNISGVDMEAAGLMDATPGLIIRGICDYADSHKNKMWQPFAAATAAAYAKELLLVIPASDRPTAPSSSATSIGPSSTLFQKSNKNTVAFSGEEGRVPVSASETDHQTLNYGGNALIATSSYGHKETVRLLIGKGADVNAGGGEYGNALNAASCYGHTEIVRLLIDKGADVNAEGGKYGNALNAASCHGHIEIVRLLIDKGADVNAGRGEYGNALVTASRLGSGNIIRLLIEAGTTTH